MTITSTQNNLRESSQFLLNHKQVIFRVSTLPLCLILRILNASNIITTPKEAWSISHISSLPIRLTQRNTQVQSPQSPGQLNQHLWGPGIDILNLSKLYQNAESWEQGPKPQGTTNRITQKDNLQRTYKHKISYLQQTVYPVLMNFCVFFPSC